METTNITPPKEAAENKLHEIPLRITDTTLRDAHQSLWATRMRLDDMLPILETIDSAGYYSLEVWGGATFDVCLRFMRENPWERLRKIKALAKHTPLQMLLRGQNLVGYRSYSTDVVERFVALAHENGMDIFRVFDALNDTRNLEVAIKAVKKYGGHAQGTLSYTISPVHSVEKFVQYAKEQVDLGIDSICIKDMAGILSPIGAERLVSALVGSIKVPIQVHCHASSGMAVATYVEAVRAGAGAIDCAITSLAGTSSQPPVETLVAIFKETNYAANLDMEALATIDRYFAELAPRRRQSNLPQPVIDPDVLVHQIPGGMISNFRSQLEQQKALDKLPEALIEVSRVREDLGWPPLVTPTSQIVGTQAVMNVLAGERYKMVPNEVKNYLRGQYGRPPGAIDQEIMKKILGDEIPDPTPKAMEPGLPKAAMDLDSKYIEHEEDIVSFAILPEPALEYFKWRAAPEGQRPPIPVDLELEKRLTELAGAKQSASPAVAPVVTAGDPALLSADDYKGIAEVLGKIGGLSLDTFTLTKGEVTVSLRASGTALAAAPAISAIPAPATPVIAALEPQAVEAWLQTVNAPIGGTFYSSAGAGNPVQVKIGDTVKAGDCVCVVEAMKLFNEIIAPVNCLIVKLFVESGQTVEKNQPLVGIKEI